MDYRTVRETMKKLHGCAKNDKCEKVDCAYFIRPDELAEMLEWIEALIDDEEQLVIPE